MHRSELGQVVDPEALDVSAGARGRLQIEVPAAWVAGGVELDVVVPAKLVCDRCDGGGCDACGRSGALRAPESEADRAVHLCVPPGSAAGIALRIVRPFGDNAAIEQLIVAIRAGAAPSPGVVRRSPPPQLALSSPIARPQTSSAAFRVALAVAVVLAVVAALASR